MFLVPPRFLKSTPARWLPHLPRFLKGIQVRLTKLLNAGLSRDRSQMIEAAPRTRALAERILRHRKENVIDPGREEYRWLLEEFRISLFAQELKTSAPVSAKRLDALWVTVLP